MSDWYNNNKERVRAYRMKKALARPSDKEVEEYLRNTMPETFAALQKEVAENKARYNVSKEEKAKYLYQAYKSADKEKGYDNTITVKWIHDNILSSKCIYCNNADWTELGADRVDNTKGHTPDNVVCSCRACNNRRNTSSFEEWLNKCVTWGYMDETKKNALSIGAVNRKE